MVFIGIDPGQKGAIAFLLKNDVKIYDMPLLPNKEINGSLIYTLFKNEISECLSISFFFCALEKAQAMPEQGIVSTFNYGMGFGVLKGVLESSFISYQEISPLKWKNEFGLSKKNKKESVVVAEKMFPNSGIDFYTPKGRLLDGRAEALLLAEYARRMYYARRLYKGKNDKTNKNK